MQQRGETSVRRSPRCSRSSMATVSETSAWCSSSSGSDRQGPRVQGQAHAMIALSADRGDGDCAAAQEPRRARRRRLHDQRL